MIKRLGKSWFGSTFFSATRLEGCYTAALIGTITHSLQDRDDCVPKHELAGKERRLSNNAQWIILLIAKFTMKSGCYLT